MCSDLIIKKTQRDNSEPIKLASLKSYSAGTKIEEKTDNVTLSGASLDSEYVFVLNTKLKYFYSSEFLNDDGLPLAGALNGNDSFWGNDVISIFDVVYTGLGWGLRVTPKHAGQKWSLLRENNKITLTLNGGDWTLDVYRGNEPDWAIHSFPFHDLPEADAYVRHAFVRGLLDFFGGTRCSALGIYSQKPNTNGVYCGDGIPDTYFQFLATYPYLSPIRRSYLQTQIKWLGKNMRHDGCIPWGGCNTDKPYYHLWKRDDCGLFFDANGLWLEMVYRLWLWDGIKPDLSLVVRAADFYIHYMTENGLVAAEAKKKGCEWADFLQNGWHSSLVNVLAYRGLAVAQKILTAFGMSELADRYERHASRLCQVLNTPVDKGGLWNEDGYIDWRDKDGAVHPHWRIDTHMLALIFGIPDADKTKSIWRTFENEYFKDEPAVPAPYLLRGSWLDPVDEMLEQCHNFGCGKASMPGRMGSSLTAALRRSGRIEKSERIFSRLVKLVNNEEAVWEMYDKYGIGSGAQSYIEHALSPLLAIAFEKF